MATHLLNRRQISFGKNKLPHPLSVKIMRKRVGGRAGKCGVELVICTFENPRNINQLALRVGGNLRYELGGGVLNDALQ